MVLTVVYDTQNYWISGLCPLPGILNTRKHNVSETGSMDLFPSSEEGRETPALLS
jgi:hypothetical protein